MKFTFIHINVYWQVWTCEDFSQNVKGKVFKYAYSVCVCVHVCCVPAQPCGLKGYDVKGYYTQSGKTEPEQQNFLEPSTSLILTTVAANRTHNTQVTNISRKKHMK